MVDTIYSEQYSVYILRLDYSRVNQSTTRLRAEVYTWGKWHLVRLKPSYLWMAQPARGEGMYTGRLQEMSLGNGKEIWVCLIFCTPLPQPRFYLLNISLGPCFKPTYMQNLHSLQPCTIDFVYSCERNTPKKQHGVKKKIPECILITFYEEYKHLLFEKFFSMSCPSLGGPNILSILLQNKTAGSSRTSVNLG